MEHDGDERPSDHARARTSEKYQFRFTRKQGSLLEAKQSLQVNPAACVNVLEIDSFVEPAIISLLQKTRMYFQE